MAKKMRSSRFRESHRDNASDGHKEFGEKLKRLFPLCKIYAEYPYDMILKKGYSKYGVPKEVWDTAMMQEARKLRADWVLLDYCIIVEYQGEHHYGPVDYGNGAVGGNHSLGDQQFQRRRHLDKKKRRIANEAGFSLVEVPYFNKKMTDEQFLQLITQSKEID